MGGSIGGGYEGSQGGSQDPLWGDPDFGENPKKTSGFLDVLAPTPYYPRGFRRKNPSGGPNLMKNDPIFHQKMTINRRVFSINPFFMGGSIDPPIGWGGGTPPRRARKSDFLYE